MSIVTMFDSCQVQTCVDISIVNDSVLENEEIFDVTLSRTVGLDTRITLDPVDGEVEITDNDGTFIDMCMNGYGMIPVHVYRGCCWSGENIL